MIWIVWPLFPSRAAAVGQDEHPLSLVRRANVFRSEEERRRNDVAVRFQSLSDWSKMPDRESDVLEENKGRSECSDEVEHGPDGTTPVASHRSLVLEAALLTSGRVGLAGVPGDDDVDPGQLIHGEII
jgi:hypothetical protein